MTATRRRIVGVLAVALLVAGCGSSGDRVAATSEGSDRSPAPSSGGDVGSDGSEPAASDVQPYSGPEGSAPANLAEVAGSSDAIVVGTISEITEEDITPPAIRAAGDRYLKVVYELEVEELLRGSTVSDPVLVYGYLDIQRSGEAPTTRVGVDGYRAEAGDRLIVGLAPPYPQKADLELSTPQSLFVLGDAAKAASLADARTSSPDPAVKALGEETSRLTDEEIVTQLRSS